MSERRDDGTGAILAYHDATKHSPISVRSRAHFLDWDNKPHPFKAYAGLDGAPLPDDVPSLGVPALEAIGVTTVGEPVPGPDLASLARLLVVGAGVHHAQTFPGSEVIHFRNYASAGALYPVEVYVACGDLPGLLAGVYHFDPAGRALTRLREGDHRGHLVRAAASEPAVARAPAVLVLTGIPWRTAWKYTERGYRHLFWDAGMILANVLALAVSAQLPTRVVMGFADAEVSRLLGLEDRREFPLCLVPVGADGGEVAPASGSPEKVSFEFAPLSRTAYVFEGILKANDAGRLQAAYEVARWREGFGGSRRRKRSSAAPGALGADLSNDTLEAVIRRRGSARVFSRGSIPARVLTAILERATVGVPTDYAPDGARLVEPYLIANAVEGLAAGVYVFRDGALRLLRAGDLRREAGFLCLEQQLGRMPRRPTSSWPTCRQRSEHSAPAATAPRSSRPGSSPGGSTSGLTRTATPRPDLPSTTTKPRGSSHPTPRARAACWSLLSARARARVTRDCSAESAQRAQGLWSAFIRFTL